MPARSNAFQQLIFLLHSQLDTHAMVTESKMLPDQRTGDEREIDVMIEGSSGGYPVVIAVECIDHGRSATIEWVEQIWAKHQDLHTNKVVLVSRSGFTKNAEAKAKELGYVTLSLEEAEVADWLSDVVNSNWRVNAILSDDESQTSRPIGGEVTLFTKDRSTYASVQDVVQNIVSSAELGKVILEHMHNNHLTTHTFTADYTFPEPAVAKDDRGIDHSIGTLRITLNARRAQTPVPLRSGRVAGANVAYGEGEGGAGKLRIAVVEQSGKKLVADVRQKTGNVWKPLVHIDENRDASGV
jgi:hypothetical protein